MEECKIDPDLMVNFVEDTEVLHPLPQNLAGFDGISGINDIDYLCGAKYRGKLQGKYRHGVGALIYAD